MKKFGGWFKKIYFTILFVALFGSFITATYAWFSSNSVVKTDMASSSTGADRVELLLSSDGGNGFKGGMIAPIIQVNAGEAERLMPVSTADLNGFVYNSGTVSDSAVHFTKVEGEKYYYHGRIYMKAVTDGHDENDKMQIYLDQDDSNGGTFFRNVQGNVLNAARLGLKFDGGTPKIFRLSDGRNPETDRKMNTVLNGVALQENQVIALNGDTMSGVSDPAQPLESCMVGADGMPLGGSAKPLYTLELNRVYAVDIFFYLEGCDPDCTDAIQMNELDFHLAFYGVLE